MNCCSCWLVSTVLASIGFCLNFPKCRLYYYLAYIHWHLWGTFFQPTLPCLEIGLIWILFYVKTSNRERNGGRHQCECGSSYRISDTLRHKHAIKYQNYVKNKCKALQTANLNKTYFTLNVITSTNQ